VRWARASTACQDGISSTATGSGNRERHTERQTDRHREKEREREGGWEGEKRVREGERE
jgi:hypothetical protein